MTNYLLELSLVHTTLWLGYKFLLRKDRNYAFMRFYLIASVVLALTIPLLKLPKLPFGSEEQAIAETPLTPLPEVAGISIAESTTLINLETILPLLYLAGSAVLLFKFVSSMFHLARLSRTGLRQSHDEIQFQIVTGISGSFTFFRWIFIGNEVDKEDYNIVLAHEQAHVSMGHTYDLVLLELFKVCFWWLPTAWLINRDIREIHEYQADDHVLKTYSIDEYSSTLMSAILKSNGLSLASSFHDSLILKRLAAMGEKTKVISSWKLGALCALCASLLIVLACTEDVKQSENKIFTVVEAYPEFEGGPGALRQRIMQEVKYPLAARQKNAEGRVDVQFVVDKDGSLSDLRVANGFDPDCDAEALRVLKSLPAFKPATQNGRAVRVRMVIPIIFKLNTQQTNNDGTPQGIVVIGESTSIDQNLTIESQYIDGEWLGTVYDEEGEELPGANIVIAGTTTGTKSDLNGKFKINADPDQVLYVSFIGYEPVKLEVQ
jgi:TonB family protein